MYIPDAAGCQFEDGVADEAEGDALRGGETEGDEDDAEECGDAFRGVVPRNQFDRPHHEETDDDQRGGDDGIDQSTRLHWNSFS